MPLDFTELHNRTLGAVHSRYAVRHVHALYVLAKVRSRLVVRRRNLRLSEAKYTVRHRREYSSKHEMDAAMEIRFQKRKMELSEFEAQETIIEAITQGFEDLVRAASREMSRRANESAPRD